jgi:hypothetical protein
MSYVQITELRIYRDASGWRWSVKRDGVFASGKLVPLYGDGEESLVSALPEELRDSGQFVDIDRTPPE